MKGALSQAERTAAVCLGQRLRAAREQAGLSLREVAGRVGLRDHTVLIKYERGATAPTSARLRSLAQALGCSAAALLADRDDAMAIIAAVDRADDVRLAQLQLVLDSLEAAPPPPVVGGRTS
jgi:transcriptional regulator with XRE-family HTH domain